MPLAMMRTRAASPHAEGLQRGLRALIQADVVPAVYAEDLNPVGAGAIGGLALDEPTARKVAEIEAEAKERYGVTRVRIVHRLGRMEIGETSVAVAVSSPHRKEAFEACRFAIDTLKHKAPIWKKEFYADGSSWLEGPGGCAHA